MTASDPPVSDLAATPAALEPDPAPIVPQTSPPISSGSAPPEAGVPAAEGAPVETMAKSTRSSQSLAFVQASLRSADGKILLQLPPEQEGDGENTTLGMTWQEIWQQLQQRLQGGDRFWQPNAEVHLLAGDRLLDARQLQEIADSLAGQQLQLKRVFANRRQTAVAAAAAGYAVEQQAPHVDRAPAAERALADPLYLQTTLRSGAEVRHPGTVVLVGDVNPGSAIVADGDILVWGRLRGVAHAGAGGNRQCRIMALQMEPTQLRIAAIVARAPEKPTEFHPEVAYVTDRGRIRISRQSEFAKRDFDRPQGLPPGKTQSDTKPSDAKPSNVKRKDRDGGDRRNQKS